MRSAALALFVALGATASALAQSFSFTFSGPPGEYISAGQSYSYTSQNASLHYLPIAGAAAFTVTSPPSPQPFQHIWQLALKPYPGTRLDPGVYSGAARWPFQSQQPGLSLDGDGRGCNTLTGTFTVLSSTYLNGQLIALHATFEQHCEGGPLAATGEIQIEAAPIPVVSPQLLLLLAFCFALIGMFALNAKS